MFHQTVILGNLATAPELRKTPNGVDVCNFLVIVDGRTKEAKKTRFKVTCWRKLALLAHQYLSKGRAVLAVGVVDTNAYLNQTTGEPDSILVLTADTIRFLPDGKGGGGGELAAEAGENDDEIPFMGKEDADDVDKVMPF